MGVQFSAKCLPRTQEVKEGGAQTEMPGFMLGRAWGRQCVPRQEAKGATALEISVLTPSA